VSAVGASVVGGAALVVAVVLLTAGLSKAVGSTAFAEQIAEYRIVPYKATGAVARAVWILELAAGGLLMGGLLGPAGLRQAGAGLALFLFTVFVVVLAHALRSGREIACSCFGGNGELETVGAHSLVRAGLLLTLAAVALLPSKAGAAPEIAAVAAMLGALVAVLSETTRLFGPLRKTTTLIIAQILAEAAPADPSEATS
jgi:Methylamine utilisation protein MauE